MGLYLSLYETVSQYDVEKDRLKLPHVSRILAASADTAVQVWGGQWRMPTETQFQELIDECTWTWTTNGGTNGYEVAKGNNSIFLPVTGYWNNDSQFDAEKGYYWCSTPYGSNNAHNLTFSNSSKSQGISLRSYGLPIRPVMD